jgi:hypothetical protein
MRTVGKEAAKNGKRIAVGKKMKETAVADGLFGIIRETAVANGGGGITKETAVADRMSGKIRLGGKIGHPTSKLGTTMLSNLLKALFLKRQSFRSRGQKPPSI